MFDYFPSNTRISRSYVKRTLFSDLVFRVRWLRRRTLLILITRIQWHKSIHARAFRDRPMEEKRCRIRWKHTPRFRSGRQSFIRDRWHVELCMNGSVRSIFLTIAQGNRMPGFVWNFKRPPSNSIHRIEKARHCARLRSKTPFIWFLNWRGKFSLFYTC